MYLAIFFIETDLESAMRKVSACSFSKLLLWEFGSYVLRFLPVKLL